MNGILRNSVLSFSLLFLLGCTAHQPSEEIRPDSLFSQWNRPDCPGCSVAVIRDGSVVYSAGFGMSDLEHGIPLQPDSVFYVGSVSKQFVAFSILLLEEEGNLSLDDDIRLYLPDFPDYGQTITLRHLLHHTSGLRDYLELWLLAGRDYLDKVPIEEAYELVKAQRTLNFMPGTRHLYSNSCYLLFPLIVEKVTGRKFKDFAKERIFDPLGMASTHFHDDNTHLIPGRAFAYRQNGDGTFGNLHMRFDLVGSGGLYSTVEDLAKWDANFYDNKLGGGRPLIDRMLENGRLNDGSEVDYAAALVNGEYRGLRTVSHSGALGGYRAQLLRFPGERFSVAILCNLETSDPTGLAYKVADLYLEDELSPLPEPAGTGFSIEPEYFGQYSGTFSLSDGRSLRVWSEEGLLLARLGDGETIEISAVSRTDFKVGGSNGHITFGSEGPLKFNSVELRTAGQTVSGRRFVPNPLSPAEVRAYAGDYYSKELATTYVILAGEGRVTLKVGLGSPISMDRVGEGAFNAGFIHLVFEQKTGEPASALTVSSGRVMDVRFTRDSCP